MPDWNGYIKGGVNTAVNLASGNYAGAALSGIGATMSLFGGGSSSSARKAAEQQFQHNLALQKQAQEWNEYMYKNRYTFQRQDLENAGINPLFGMGQAPSVTSGTNSVGMADYVGEQKNKFEQAMEIINFKQNNSAKKAQIRLTEEQANTQIQETNLKALEVIGKRLEIENMPKKLRLELEEAQSRIVNNIAKANESYASTRLKNAQTARENLEQAPMKRYEKFVRQNPELAKIIENLDKTGTSWKTYTNIMKQGGTGLRLLLNK